MHMQYTRDEMAHNVNIPEPIRAPIVGRRSKFKSSVAADAMKTEISIWRKSARSPEGVIRYLPKKGRSFRQRNTPSVQHGLERGFSFLSAP